MNNYADIGTASMAQGHIQACLYCREKLAMLRDLKARSLPRAKADRPKRHLGIIAAAAASLLMALGIGMYSPRVPEIEPKGPMIYRSAQFDAISPVGSFAGAPEAFKWEPVADAATYRLRLMDVDRTDVWSVETSATTVAPPLEVRQKMTPGRGYLWMVVARNKAGEKISETDLQKLYIRILKPPASKETR